MVDIKNEIWKEISINPNYLVSNYGRVNLKKEWFQLNMDLDLKKNVY